MTRNGLARLVAALGGVALLVFLWLSLQGQGSSVDVFLLSIATVVHFIVVVAWWLAPFTPRWVVAGYGLILASSGLGFLVVAPPEAPAVMAFYGMLAGGALSVVAAIIDR
ncbi:MAG TPA: hypothetical protein VM305_10210 [Candidatus Limnocylindrales bacterium]|nr:hypothetical protein [Candidatus Limnocylindrales bacterium]